MLFAILADPRRRSEALNDFQSTQTRELIASVMLAAGEYLRVHTDPKRFQQSPLSTGPHALFMKMTSLLS